MIENQYNNKTGGKERTNYIVCHKPERIFRPRIEQYNFFIDHYRDKNRISRSFFKGINKAARYAQKAVRVNRVKKTGWELFYGSSWWSITDDFSRYVVSEEKPLKALFDNWTFAADEFGLQTLIMNSSYKETVFHSGEQALSDNLRMVDFNRGNGLGSPYVYTMNDFEEIRVNPNFFCRKFDADIDQSIIDKIIGILKE